MTDPLPADGLLTRPAPMRSPSVALASEPRPRRKLLLPARRQNQGGLVLFLVVSFVTFCVALAILVRYPAESSSPPPSPPTADFTYGLKHSAIPHNQEFDTIDLRYDGTDELHGCNVDVRLWYDDRQSVVVGRLWSVWSSGETKTVSLPPHFGSIQYIELTGTGHVDSQDVRIAQNWEVRADAD